MKHRRILACMIAAVTLGASGGAQGDTLSPVSPAKISKPVKERKLCRSDSDTGSMIQKETCHTRTEWLAIDASGPRSVDQAAMLPVTAPLSSTGTH